MARSAARLALLGAAAWLGWRPRRPALHSLPPPPRAPSRWIVPVLAVVLVLLTGGWGWVAMARAQRAAEARALTGGSARVGATLVTRYGCGGCHSLSGVPGAAGLVGPRLDGLRQRVFIAGTLRNTPGNLIAFLVDPRPLAPGTAMPAAGLTEAEARDLAAFLYTR